MSLKCEICKEKIDTIFLDKIMGTYIGSGKKRVTVCNACQKKYGDKIKEMLAK